jgi:hypothetical protein
MKLTDEQIERFKELYNEGKNDTEIALVLGVTARDVRAKRQEYGWPQIGNKRFIQDEINRIIELAKTHTAAEIAILIGASKQGVRKVLGRNGLLDGESEDEFKCDSCRDFTPTTDMLIVQFLSEGYSLTQVAMELARDYKT